MAAWLDGVKFTPTLGGTTDWIVSTAVIGYNTPALAGAAAIKYKYHAESADLSQWEDGEGTYVIGTTTLPRTTVLYNSSATGTGPGQSGAGTKINFTTVPTVSVVALKEDMISVEEANSFTATQKKQIQANILVPAVVTTYLSGSGTHPPTVGCTRMKVTLVGGGSGGAGGGASTSGGNGGAGGNTTFGTSLLVANGGAATFVNTPTAGGTASLGTATGTAIQGGGGQGGQQASVSGGFPCGGQGGSSFFGGNGGGDGASGPGTAAATNSGSGGGGGGSGTGGASINMGSGGAAGGCVIAYINSPLSSYSYAVGAAGTAGTAGTNGTAGAAGGSGCIIVEEYFGS